MSGSPILIGIAGGTGSGKTSIAKSLLEEYGEGEVVVIEQDAYYRDLSDLSIEERHLQNFDHPDAIDIELFNQQLITDLHSTSISPNETTFRRCTQQRRERAERYSSAAAISRGKRHTLYRKSRSGEIQRQNGYNVRGFCGRSLGQSS